MSLQPYQQRVIDEEVELDKKVAALGEFIEENSLFARLDPKEQHRMRQQYFHMFMYSKILHERIEAFPK